MKSKYFDLAKKLAVHSTHHQHRIGSVVVKKNRILGVGFNQLKTHTKSPHPFRSIHAEFAAILQTDPEELEGATIYVYRQTRQGEPANSKPCQHCARMIKSVGITTVYYSHEDGYKEENVA